ncbi:MAG: GNAT family N-acetyltransferase [Nitrososphaerota archaeon]
MEVAPLDQKLETIFWEYIGRDIPHHYFFAYDWRYEKGSTRIFLALKGGRVDGAMLIYGENIVQLRGSSEAAKALLERLELDKATFTCEEQHKPHVLEKYKSEWIREIILMLLRRGEEKIHVSHPVVSLNEIDAERIAAILREVKPEHWGEITGRQVIEGMSRGTFWKGIRVGGEIVSVASSRITEWLGLIGIVATLEPHRNRGYATSVVSEMVKEILEKQENVILHVLGDNSPAIRVYGKIGFKPYRKYVYIKGERKQILEGATD